MFTTMLYTSVFSIVMVISYSVISVIFDLPRSTAIAELDKEKTNQIGANVKTIGAWVPSQFHLELTKGNDQRIATINSLLAKGINEYYLIMRDFNDIHSVNRTEELLKSADNTRMKVTVILLPPSEGGQSGNYDWKGWIRYFNSLKKMHRSFDGFAIDDFNSAYRSNDNYSLANNVEYMIASNLSSALVYKDMSVSFYPVIYIESGFQRLVAKEYGRFISGIILASTIPESITGLEESVKAISILFDKKPIKYIVYSFNTSTNKPLNDIVIDATLSVSTRVVDGIIIYVDISNPVIQYFLHNRSDTTYLSVINKMEKIRLGQENTILLNERRDIFICITCLTGNFHLNK